ncbi:MAG: hypothetical protein RIS76_3836 [Verrucomicrobiota bacterium]
MQRSGWLAAGILLWLGSGGFWMLASEPVRPLLVGPSPASTGLAASVPTASALTVQVVVLNPGDAPLNYRFPAEFAGRAMVGGRTQEVTLRRTAEADGNGAIAPGAFARQEYRFALPEDFNAGSVTITLTENPDQQVTVQVGDGWRTKAGRSESVAQAATLAKSSGGTPLKSESVALEFFREHFFPHEPMYVVMGWESPNVKFQISFKYRLLNGEVDDPGWLVRQAPALTNLYVAYTQTSLWDTSAPSSPFYDTSYKPEFFYQWQRVDRHRWADWFTMDLQGGLQHASNGQEGSDSRSLNVVYFMPTFYLGDTDRFHVRLAPRVYAYIGDLEDNPDIADYYGHVQLRGMMGWADSVQLAVIGTIGDGFHHGSAQLDLTYPLYRFGGRNLSVYLDLQYFTGYGESLLNYNERSSIFRAGFSLWR